MSRPSKRKRDRGHDQYSDANRSAIEAEQQRYTQHRGPVPAAVNTTQRDAAVQAEDHEQRDEEPLGQRQRRDERDDERDRLRVKRHDKVFAMQTPRFQ